MLAILCALLLVTYYHMFSVRQGCAHVDTLYKIQKVEIKHTLTHTYISGPKLMLNAFCPYQQKIALAKNANQPKCCLFSHNPHQRNLAVQHPWASQLLVVFSNAGLVMGCNLGADNAWSSHI